jgi:hypothetical protein
MINHVFIREHSFRIETVAISRPGFLHLKMAPPQGVFLALRQPKPDLPDKPIPGALLPDNLADQLLLVNRPTSGH